MGKRDLLTALAIAVVFALAAALLGTIGAGATGRAPAGRYVSQRYGFSLTVPGGWHHSAARLVPRLLDPWEIVSLGNFGMRAGGGGNCGREPSASIEAMRPGDALVTIQEVAVSAKLRPRLRHNFPPRPPRFEEALAPHVFLGDSRTAGPVRYEKLVFSDRGRAFEALLYVDGPPTRALRGDIAEILDGLRFSPRTRPAPAQGRARAARPTAGARSGRASPGSTRRGARRAA